MLYEVITIARGRNPRKTRLVESALESLRFFKSDELRGFVLDNILKAKYPCDYLPILVSNYQKGDYVIVNEIIDKSDDYDYIHSLVFGIIDIYRNNPTKECKEPLEKMYSKLNCGLHRYDIVNLLIDNKVLSDELAEELRYDSYDEIRKIYNVITSYSIHYTKLYDGDITKLNLDIVPKHDILCAGFPCQPFSISGKMKGFEDTRGTLIYHVFELIEKRQPKVVLLENVKHLVYHDSKRTLSTIVQHLEEMGYVRITSYNVCYTKLLRLPGNLL